MLVVSRVDGAQVRDKGFGFLILTFALVGLLVPAARRPRDRSRIWRANHPVVDWVLRITTFLVMVAGVALGFGLVADQKPLVTVGEVSFVVLAVSGASLAWVAELLWGPRHSSRPPE